MTTQERRGPKYPKAEAVQRGEAIYESLRRQVETEENIGKVMVIDIESGDYEIDDDQHHIEAVYRLRARHADPEIYAARIGYATMGTIGGSMKRRPPL